MIGRSTSCLSSWALRKKGVTPGRLARPGSSSIEWMPQVGLLLVVILLVIATIPIVVMARSNEVAEVGC